MHVPPCPPQGDGSADRYIISSRPTWQQVLPAASFNRTYLFAYGSPEDPTTYSWPAPTIQATEGRPVQVKVMPRQLPPARPAHPTRTQRTGSVARPASPRVAACQLPHVQRPPL